MKSVMEVAPSLSKAIERGWERAGKPREFTVKVLQAAEKNFLGFTKTAAKIAILFEETAAEKRKQKSSSRVEPKKSIVKKQAEVKRTEQKPSTRRTLWTDERIAFANQWVKALLTIMKRQDIAFTTSVDRSAIRFNFEKNILRDNEKEKQLFRSWAYLLTQTMRHTYKQQLRNIKIIFKS